MSMLKTNAARKLTRDQVVEIRAHISQGITQGSLARYYGVSVGQIGRIARGESWGEVTHGEAAPSPATLDGIAARVMRVQQELSEAREQGMELPVSPTRRQPVSPLDDEGEAPDELPPAGLTALQQRAAGFGMDIEKLLKTEEN